MLQNEADQNATRAILARISELLEASELKPAEAASDPSRQAMPAILQSDVDELEEAFKIRRSATTDRLIAILRKHQTRAETNSFASLLATPTRQRRDS